MVDASTPNSKSVKRKSTSKVMEHSGGKKRRISGEKTLKNTERTQKKRDGEPYRSEPRKKNRVAPKTVRMIRKKLNSSNDLEFSREAKKKIKRAGNNLAEVIKPIAARVCPELFPEPLVGGEEVAEQGKNSEGTIGVITKPNKLSKVGDLPLAESASKQALWFSKQFETFFAKSISSLEKICLTDDHFLTLPESQADGKPAEDNNLSRLASHVSALVSKKSVSAQVGSPTVVVISASAVRCTEVLRAMKEVGREFGSAKLFAKHMKIETQVEILKKSIFVAAGTPARVERLTSLGNLGLSSLKILAIDLQKTAKGLTLLDIPETRSDFWEFYRKHIQSLVLEQGVQLCLI